MHTVFVNVHVKPESVEAFKEALLENARNSIHEAGVRRFDVFQMAEDPTRFTIIETYLTPEDQQKHRETAHYLRWRDTVVDMMAEPRQGIKQVNLFPGD